MDEAATSAGVDGHDSGNVPASTTAEPLHDVVTADLRDGGVLSRALEGYEERAAQIAMAQRVADALEAGVHLIARSAHRYRQVA